MAEVATVLDREAAPGIARVAITPPSCGRCETDGGHCDHEPRELLVRVPEELRDGVREGYRVRIGVTSDAIVRSVGLLFLLPLTVAATVLALTWSWAEASADAPLRHALAGLVPFLGTMILVAVRGGSTRDLPVVTDLLAGDAPVLRSVDLVRVGDAGDAVPAVAEDLGEDAGEPILHP
jgi:positive regulator of sigma E activity